ncbi:DUF4188 domain-containing protein [Paenibacillus sp. 7541]|uniref:DUF4188 domain-containing protein n=1 Tax=Paenibacillus sp. 7541 TaxID=2026236 RepID=UPI000BA64CDF|nr:DUF4188 domain-containing protein [Paenibacillus sp. 7541]PAK47948.1 transcriptional regulator [Paenibacillus sp. 7541]
MGNSIFTGPYTTDNSEDIVVFIIGMRINKPLAIHKWLPVFHAMPGMIRELYTHKEELGFLSMESYLGLRTTAMIQYWRSVDDLIAYAHNKKHMAAWENFNKHVGHNPAVGVYHETYQLQGGAYEAMYRNMPKYGLGKAMPHIPVTPKNNSARKRLGSHQP